MIGISKLKLGNAVLDQGIYIENYEILRFVRNQHREGVDCYIRSDISYKLNLYINNLYNLHKLFI